ncbi:MAG: ceramidase domain-containing protein [Hyphomicrobiales bacterium]|nr:ceramidase domain-containing protein [Hyphomicrobiales bacterium]
MAGSHWHTPVDIYCERLSPEFWAEPLNAISNAAFLLAAFGAFAIWRRRGADDWPALVLILLIGLIGIGSFLFHTFATRWAAAADVLPIILCLLAFLFIAQRRMFGLSAIAAALGVVLFLGLNVLNGFVLPEGFLNGSGTYLPALAAILFGGVVLRMRADPAAKTLFFLTGIFALSIALRSIDMAVCDALPIGVHYFWHILNGLAFYIAARVVMERRQTA